MRDDIDTVEPPAPAPLMRSAAPTMLVVALATWATTAVALALAPPPMPGRIVWAVGGQLVLMVVLMPLAAHRAATRMGALFRAGVTADAFGVAMVVVAATGPAVTLWMAIRLYLLVAAVALFLVGLFNWLRGGGRPAWAGTLGLAVAGAAFALGRFVVPAAWPLRSADEATALSRLLANTDLHAAIRDVLDLGALGSTWWSVLLVYGVGALLVWTGPVLIGPPPASPPARPADEGPRDELGEPRPPGGQSDDEHPDQPG